METTEERIQMAMRENDTMICSDSATSLTEMIELLRDEFVPNTLTRVMLDDQTILEANELSSLKATGTMKVSTVQIVQNISAFSMRYQINIIL